MHVVAYFIYFLHFMLDIEKIICIIGLWFFQRNVMGRIEFERWCEIGF